MFGSANAVVKDGLCYFILSNSSRDWYSTYFWLPILRNRLVHFLSHSIRPNTRDFPSNFAKLILWLRSYSKCPEKVHFWYVWYQNKLIRILQSYKEHCSQATTQRTTSKRNYDFPSWWFIVSTTSRDELNVIWSQSIRQLGWNISKRGVENNIVHGKERQEGNLIETLFCQL